MFPPPKSILFDPSRPDFAPYGLTCVHWQPAPMRRPDHHNEIEINYLESGTLTYLLGGTKTVVEAGRLSVFWAAIPHQIIDFGDTESYFVATIPLPWFLQWRLPDHFVQPLMQGRLISSPLNGLSATDGWMLSRWEADLEESRADLQNAALLEMHARFVRLACEIPVTPPTIDERTRRATVTDGGLNKVEQMACFIARNYTEKLTVQQISDVVHLHPNYAMSLFHKTFGTTLVDYLTQHRISHAQRLLATTDQKIVDVAFDSGFCSISRFNDAFRRTCGCSPRAYRKHQVSGSERLPPAPTAGTQPPVTTSNCVACPVSAL